ncbi:MAG: prenyltransferase/squalene oxidase repeat-containing protein [Candidatus Thorarchaeota archaeon]
MVQVHTVIKMGLVIGLLVLLSVPIVDMSQRSNNVTQEFSNTPSPSVNLAQVYDSSTLNFVNMTRNIDGNDAVSIEQIFFRIGTLKILDPALSSLSPSEVSYLISQVLSFQRSSGGFGNWKGDRSSVSPTHMALQVLDWLGYSGLNNTAIEQYLDRLQNTLTDGFNSHLLDTDSDVHSSYHAIRSYELIGSAPTNVTAVVEYFRRAQNLDGGFGLQTNNEKGIFWTSRATVTQDALLGLAVYGAEAGNPTAALNFVQGLQLIDSGGYVNQIDILSTSASYTAAALDSIYYLNGTALNITSVTNYLYSLETLNGGFRYNPISTDSSLIGTYFAVHALSILGESPTNITATIDYVSHPPISDGYGGVPGDSPSLRETFDAVYTQILMDQIPDNVQGIIDYVASYRNPDGGFGLTGSFVESTLRALETYDLLGVAFPSPSETITYLQNLQQPNGGFVKTAGDTTAFVVSTYRAVRALEILEALPLNVNNAISFLQGIQNGDGGWGGFIGDTSDVTSTYRAVRGLDILNSQPLNPNQAITFLQSSQNADGGFRRSQFDNVRPNNVSHAIYTYSAVRALHILGTAPLDLIGAHDYITSLQNLDGGYAEHPGFTSNIAYTYTSVFLLSNFDLYTLSSSTTTTTNTNFPPVGLPDLLLYLGMGLVVIAVITVVLLRRRK